MAYHILGRGVKMAKSIRPTKKAGASKTMKAVPGKAPGQRSGKKISKANLDEMFRAAVSGNESFQISEEDDYDKAVEHFNKVVKLLDAIIAIDPGYRDAVNYKGMMLYGCGSISEAIQCFNAILKTNPVDKEALNNKGIALYGLGRDEDALKCVEAAIEIDKRYVDAYMNKAVILHALGRLEEADKFLRKARALENIIG
jgi:tetratricopeptide (TPR) repeat protein